MHVPTHILSGWCAASLLNLTPRERFFAMAAAALPDIDGLGIIFGQTTYLDYHHLLAHNLLFAVVVAVVFASFAKHPLKTGLLCFLLVHLHLLMDYFGSGPGWPIYYLWPFDRKFKFINWNAWPLFSWQNGLAAALLLAWTILIALRQGITPVELITPRLDREFVAWIRSKLRKFAPVQQAEIRS